MKAFPVNLKSHAIYTFPKHSNSNSKCTFIKN
jgi:hypothetical protein